MTTLAANSADELDWRIQRDKQIRRLCQIVSKSDNLLEYKAAVSQILELLGN